AVSDCLRERRPSSSNYPDPSRIDVFNIRGQGPIDQSHDRTVPRLGRAYAHFTWQDRFPAPDE
ncbi:hypothetical protein, partial [Streptomyces sp. NPDC002403]